MNDLGEWDWRRRENPLRRAESLKDAAGDGRAHRNRVECGIRGLPMADDGQATICEARAQDRRAGHRDGPDRCACESCVPVVPPERAGT